MRRPGPGVDEALDSVMRAPSVGSAVVVFLREVGRRQPHRAEREHGEQDCEQTSLRAALQFPSTYVWSPA